MYLNQSSFKPRVALVLLVMLCQCPVLFAQIQFGNSYVNVSKKQAGGTVQPGDTLEIRTNYYFPTGYNSNNLYYMRYLDNIPTHTAYVTDSLRLITNEGKLYKKWTDASGDDPGTYLAAPPAGQYNIRINVGNNVDVPANNGTTSLTGAGTWITGPANSSSKPRIGAGSLLTTSFLVRVTGNVGDTITLGAGRLIFKTTNSTNASNVTINTTQYKILITNNDPICSDAVGRNFVAEAGGTFDSGTTQNRSYGPAYLISGYQYKPLAYATADQTGDGSYTIVNNLSPSGSIFPNSLKQPFCGTAVNPPLAPTVCENRMFRGHWDIIGDHTGSTTPAGNPPAAPGVRGGYMLVVNAAYYTSEAYKQTITGLCPNTSYEFSCWVRNVCTNCGIDSNRTQTWQPGVKPNLTFVINGLDRYSSGEVDTVGWVKKGFMFQTGSNQTSIQISIRNNASGGGGNDWAIDDIALVTCNPNLNMNPGPTAAACYGQQVNISCIVRSYFNNYVNYEWESSPDGIAWTSTGLTGTGTPVYNNGLYEYEAHYPSFLGDSASHGLRYRIKVASSAANLAANDCSFNASSAVVVLVNNCQWILSTKLLTFTAQLQDNYTALRWNTENEAANTIFEIERSNDGTHYNKIGSLHNKATGMGATYNFNDPAPVAGTAFYRLKSVENGNYQYSRIVMVSNKPEFNIHSLVNPFTNQLEFNVISSENGMAYITLTDAYGRQVKQSRVNLSTGMNPVKLYGLDALSKGAYSLRVQLKDKIINKQVLKLERK